MPEFQPALTVDQLPENGFKAVDIADVSYLVGRVNGQLFACLDKCPHAKRPLKIGKLRGEELQCAWHGWRFDVLTGKSIPDNPAFHLTQIPVKIEGNQVLLAV